jgi:F-type H+-transporting ATPase subunit delta
MNPRIAGNYARAVYDLARESSSESAVGEELRSVTQGLLADADTVSFLSSRVIGRVTKRRILRELLEGKVAPHVASLLHLLAGRGRLGYLGAITREYSRIEELGRGVRHVTVATSTALDEAQREKIRASLAKRLGKTVVLEPVVRPGIIGGVQIETEGVRYELSVDALLRQLRDRLSQG